MPRDFRANEETQKLLQKLSYDMGISECDVIARSLFLMKHVVNATIAGSDVVIKHKSGEEDKIIGII